MKKFFAFIGGILFLGSLWTTVIAAGNNNDPVNMLNSVAEQTISALKARKATLQKNPTVVYSLANKYIVPHADIAEMSKRVLPPSVWEKATPSQRAQFQNEFTTLLVRTYASALADYKDQTVRFFPVRGGFVGKNNVRVDSQIIRTDGPAISVSYRMLLKGSQWKLYDLTVEGVSLLESFRSQFADKLAQGDITDLIRELKQHNANNSGEK